MHSLDAFITAIGRHAKTDGTHSCALPGVKLVRASSPTVPMPVIYEPTLCVVAQGVKQASLGTTAFRYDPEHYLVASVDLPVMGSVIEASPAQPYLCLQLDIDMAELSDLAIRHPAFSADTKESSAGLTLTKTTAELLDAAVRLVRLLDSPQDLAALAPLVMREILYRILIGPGGASMRHLAQADSRLNQVARAIIWIKNNFNQQCRIEEAAAIAGMSRSAFHLHFKKITTLSPIEFRTQLRMQEARRLMVSDAMDAASAGFQVGYESPSQFSRDYARLFGSPPAKHACQLRNAV